MLLRSNVRPRRQLPHVVCVRCREIPTPLGSVTPALAIGGAAWSSRRKYAIPLLRTVSPPPPWWSAIRSLLPFDTVIWVRIMESTDSRLLDAPPNTSLLHLVSTFPSFLSGGAPVTALHLSRPISLWHFDRYIVFPLGTPCEVRCGMLLGVKRFLYSFDRF